MPRTRSPYPAAFGERIVALHRAGRSIDDLAKEFEPCAATIHSWVKQSGRDAGRRADVPSSAGKEELRRLRRENRQLRQERDILSRGEGDRGRSAAAQAPERPVRSERRDVLEVFEFMTANQAEFPVDSEPCRAIGPSDNGERRGR